MSLHSSLGFFARFWQQSCTINENKYEITIWLVRLSDYQSLGRFNVFHKNKVLLFNIWKLIN